MKNLIRDPNPPSTLAAFYNENVVKELHRQGHQAYCALMVIVTTPHIRSWLFSNDPKALEQCDRAVATKQKP